MIYKKLGNTDRKISVIGLGTMTFGEQTTRDEAFKIMDFAFENGINFFDTAEMYPVYPKKETQGMSEKIIGDWINSRNVRDKIVIGTKISSSHPKGIGATKLAWIRGGGNKLKFDSKNFNEALDSSLERLKTNYIDLYQLHWPERSTNTFGRREYTINKNEGDWNDFENVLEALKKFIKSGKIRHIGLSNETPYGLSKYLELSKHKNLPRMVSVQNPYSLVNRTYEVGMSEISIREKCGLLVYYPLAAGGLSGKYRDGKMPKDSRMALFKGWERHLNPLAMKAYDKYFKLAKDFDLTMVQLAQSFVNSRPFVTSNIIGATNMDQLKENVESINIEFTDEMMDRVNEIHNNNPNPSP